MKPEIKKLIGKIKKDYVRFNHHYIENKDKLSDYIAEKIKNFEKNITISTGKKYTKIITGDGLWGFIVNDDGAKFRKGDILKAKNSNSPATNAARGNIFDESYSVNWTGPHYLR